MIRDQLVADRQNPDDSEVVGAVTLVRASD
jgi:hypothetical protein